MDTVHSSSAFYEIISFFQTEGIINWSVLYGAYLDALDTRGLKQDLSNFLNYLIIY